MTRLQIGELPKFFDRYIILSEENLDLMDGLSTFSPENLFNDVEIYKAIGDEIYAPGKWTIRDLLQHCIDTERVMAYRALCFARNDETVLPGFDEELYSKNTTSTKRTLESLLEEFSIVRKSTIMLFESMDKTMLLRKGTANLTRISPLALGFVIIGHAKHHQNVIRERYYSLVK